MPDWKVIGYGAKDVVLGVAGAVAGGYAGEAGAKAVGKAGTGIDAILGQTIGEEKPAMSRAEKFDTADRPKKQSPVAPTQQVGSTEVEDTRAQLRKLGWSDDKIDKILGGPGVTDLHEVAGPSVGGWLVQEPAIVVPTVNGVLMAPAQRLPIISDTGVGLSLVEVASRLAISIALGLAAANRQQREVVTGNFRSVWSFSFVLIGWWIEQTTGKPAEALADLGLAPMIAALQRYNRLLRPFVSAGISAKTDADLSKAGALFASLLDEIGAAQLRLDMANGTRVDTDGIEQAVWMRFTPSVATQERYANLQNSIRETSGVLISSKVIKESESSEVVSTKPDAANAGPGLGAIIKDVAALLKSPNATNAANTMKAVTASGTDDVGAARKVAGSLVPGTSGTQATSSPPNVNVVVNATTSGTVSGSNTSSNSNDVSSANTNRSANANSNRGENRGTNTNQGTNTSSTKGGDTGGNRVTGAGGSSGGQARLPTTSRGIAKGEPSPNGDEFGDPAAEPTEDEALPEGDGYEVPSDPDIVEPEPIEELPPPPMYDESGGEQPTYDEGGSDEPSYADSGDSTDPGSDSIEA
jgi:hypothetical protein